MSTSVISWPPPPFSVRSESRSSFDVVHTCVAMNSTQWHSMAHDGTRCHSMAIDGNLWQSIALNGNQWHSMALDGNQWQSAPRLRAHPLLIGAEGEGELHDAAQRDRERGHLEAPRQQREALP